MSDDLEFARKKYMITSLGCLQNDLKWIIKKNEVFLVKLFWSMTMLYHLHQGECMCVCLSEVKLMFYAEQATELCHGK